MATLAGAGFGSSQGSGFIKLKQGATETTQTITSWGDTSITFTVVTTGLSNGNTLLIVQNSDGRRGYAFASLSGSVLTLRAFGKAAANLALTGTNFGSSQGSGSVTVTQGSPAMNTIDSWSDTSIQFDMNGGSLSDGAAALRVQNNLGDVVDALIALGGPDPIRMRWRS